MEYDLFTKRDAILPFHSVSSNYTLLRFLSLSCFFYIFSLPFTSSLFSLPSFLLVCLLPLRMGHTKGPTLRFLFANVHQRAPTGLSEGRSFLTFDHCRTVYYFSFSLQSCSAFFSSLVTILLLTLESLFLRPP